MLKGYRSKAYAQVYNKLGRIKWLENGLGGAVLERDILNSSYKDLCSLYPVFTHNSIGFYKEHALKQEIEQLSKDYVSLLIVTDPINKFFDDLLIWRKVSSLKSEMFGFDVFKEYKTHYIVNLQDTWVIDNNHYRNIKKSVKSNVRIENTTLHWTIVPELAQQFHTFYKNLAARHNITGMSDYSVEQIYQQLLVPGAVLFTAKVGSVTIGMMLFYIEDNEVVRYHLSAQSDTSYTLGASFALMYEAMHFFKQLGFGSLVLGAGAGESSSSAGLDRFKSGWTTYSKPNYLILKILQKDKYNELCKENRESGYLPAYR